MVFISMEDPKQSGERLGMGVGGIGGGCGSGVVLVPVKRREKTDEHKKKKKKRKLSDGGGEEDDDEEGVEDESGGGGGGTKSKIALSPTEYEKALVLARSEGKVAGLCQGRTEVGREMNATEFLMFLKQLAPYQLAMFKEHLNVSFKLMSYSDNDQLVKWNAIFVNKWSEIDGLQSIYDELSPHVSSSSSSSSSSTSSLLPAAALTFLPHTDYWNAVRSMQPRTLYMTHRLLPVCEKILSGCTFMEVVNFFHNVVAWYAEDEVISSGMQNF